MRIRTVIEARSSEQSCPSEFLAASAVLSSSAIRYRTRIWQRDRNVLLAGPASRAACITFDRPSAKSNCAEVKAVTIGKSARFTDISAPLPGDRVQFADSVGRAVGSVDQGSGPALFEQRPRPWQSRKRPDRPWRPWPAPRSQLRTSRASVSAGRVARGADVALEPLAKLVTPHRFRNGPARGRDPQAAAGQLALQIGDHLARGARRRTGSARRSGAPRD